MPLPTPTDASHTSPVTVIPPRRARQVSASNSDASDVHSNEREIRQDRRRNRDSSDGGFPRERRQFGSSHADLSEDGCELAAAIDQYKMKHHRRYITCDEMLIVMRELGYSKS
ncbi:hypothetical protein [Rhodopirellula bahusiensis]|uniref:hypothetical protein n=1 Tax=Rhodopirellula bahusiensis TaxID=2014065 RepID=UPI003266872A